MNGTKKTNEKCDVEEKKVWFGLFGFMAYQPVLVI